MKRLFLHKHKLLALALVATLSLLGAVFQYGGRAYGVEGGGGNTGGTVAGCTDNALQALCGNPAGSAGGGASWRIFRTNDAKGLDDYNGYGGDILQASYKSQAIKDCSSYGWFASFGWDGMTGSHYGYANYTFQIGPANRNGLIGESGTQYNTYNNKSLTYLEQNNYPNNTRISASTALALYKRLHSSATSIPSNVGYFCVANKKTLTAKAWATTAPHSTEGHGNNDQNDTFCMNGSALNNGNAIASTSVEYGKSATVSRAGINYTGYTFTGYWCWKNSKGKWKYWQNSADHDKYTDTIYADTEVWAVYAENAFSGGSTVAEEDKEWSVIPENKKKATGYVRSNKTVIHSIPNCDPIAGCTAKFWHLVRRDSGSGDTQYSIERTSNYTGTGIDTRVIQSLTNAGLSSLGDGVAKTLRVESYVAKLKPGMVVCEKLKFAPSGTAPSSLITTTACIHALGNAQPSDDPDPDKPEDPNANSGDTSFINIKVKNPTAAAKYNNYQREVYAKPSDIVTYRATYNPKLQYTYYLAPQQLRIDGGTIYPTSGVNTSQLMWNLFNTYKGSSLGNWNNSFSVQRGKNNASYSLLSDYSYANGSTDFRSETNDYTILASDAGKSTDEKAITNLNSATKTTPSQVSFSNNSDVNLGNVITAGKSKIAYVRVPYNFINTTEITNADTLELFAGEPATIKYSYNINPKTNSETSPSSAYATKVDAPSWRLAVSVNGGGQTLTNVQSRTTENFNVTVDKMTTGSKVALSTTIDIPDVPAGTDICITPMIYPSTSGLDTNYTDPEGNHTWLNDSAQQKCFKVKKKPSLQVWGGNVYSRGAINTSISAKNNVAGYTDGDYNINHDANNKTRYIFGSWTELGLIANGQITGLASGAGTGFAANNNGALVPAHTFGNGYNGPGNNSPLASSPGGSYETKTNFCIRSTLTFANSSCSSGKGGGLNSAASNNNISKDKTSVIGKFISAGINENVGDLVSLNDASKIIDNGTYYYRSKSSTTISGANLNKNTIQVVHADQNITIAGNLVYADSYTKLDEIPKLVIYAKNITIACNVERIDALLVAEDNVNTCDSGDPNSASNSVQLKVNGAILAGKLIPNRTYGAATGANSIIPAEIINYDPSLYLWGGNDMDGGENSVNNMDITYIHEMAPRY